MESDVDKLTLEDFDSEDELDKILAAEDVDCFLTDVDFPEESSYAPPEHIPLDLSLLQTSMHEQAALLAEAEIGVEEAKHLCSLVEGELNAALDARQVLDSMASQYAEDFEMPSALDDFRKVFHVKEEPLLPKEQRAKLRAAWMEDLRVEPEKATTVIDEVHVTRLAELEVERKAAEEKHNTWLLDLEARQRQRKEEVEREIEVRRDEEWLMREQAAMGMEDCVGNDWRICQKRALRYERRGMEDEERAANAVREHERLRVLEAERAIQAEQLRREWQREHAERQRMRITDSEAYMARDHVRQQRECSAMLVEGRYSRAMRQVERMARERQAMRLADQQAQELRNFVREQHETKRMTDADAFGLRGKCHEEKLTALRTAHVPFFSTPAYVPHEDALPLTKDKNSAHVVKEKIVPPVITCGRQFCAALAAAREQFRQLRNETSLTHPCPLVDTTAVRDESRTRSGRMVFLEAAMNISINIVKLECRMENLTEVPSMASMPSLQVLNLASNKISSLSSFRGGYCANLRQLHVQQNQLSSLDGVEILHNLEVLQATMNSITDACAMRKLARLHSIDLGNNKLVTLPVLELPYLQKLRLYRNKIENADFLKNCRSLVNLDMGRNKLVSLPSAFCSHVPLLQQLVLYENCIETLPVMHLPLLTELWMNGNKLSSLSLRGFLPSLEQLHMQSNCLEEVGAPFVLSPNLKHLDLSFNFLASFPDLSFYPLEALQLNDNPIAEMADYHQKVLLSVADPCRLSEFDNDTLFRPRTQIHASQRNLSDARLPRVLPHATDRGTAPTTATPTIVHGVRTLNTHSAEWPALKELEQWPRMCGCRDCGIGPFAEMCTLERQAAIVLLTKESRRMDLVTDSLQAHCSDQRWAIARRGELWARFHQSIVHQLQALSEFDGIATIRHAWAGPDPHAGIATIIQAWWRGNRVRKEIKRRTLENYWQQNETVVVHAQALWRGRCQRKKLGHWGLCTQAITILATKLQARWRGSSTRKKLMWAQNVAKLIDDYALPQIEMLQAPSFVNPFDIDIPDIPTHFGTINNPEESAEIQARLSGLCTLAKEDSAAAYPPSAWCASRSQPLEPLNDTINLRWTANVEGVAPQPMHSMSRPSSAAPSCVPESGPASPSHTCYSSSIRSPSRRAKVERIAQEWGVNQQTARSFLAAVKRKSKISKPKHAFQIAPPAPNTKCLRAQHAILEFQQGQFQSAPPNHKLARSARQEDAPWGK
eukprot:GEMP01005240.1.p1 GENE.GEMP01005240.1~~GEMP01005240.1.p1  ORF type:complete len:1230 (+),score=287.33 GEMP01005240.1:136-3825(+)